VVLQVFFATAFSLAAEGSALAAPEPNLSGKATITSPSEHGQQALVPDVQPGLAPDKDEAAEAKDPHSETQSAPAQKSTPDQRPGEVTEPDLSQGDEARSESPKLYYPPPEIWPWGEPFLVTTSDGMILRGMYSPPRSASKAVVIFQTGGQTDLVTGFRPLVARLAAKGYGIAAYDTRGVGQSMDRTDGTRFDLKDHSTDPEPYKKMIEDAKTVVKYLKQEKGVRPQRMVLCGVSIGGNVAIMAAAELPMEIRSVISISAGSNYHGLQPLSAAQNLGGRSLFAFAAADDSYAYTLIQQLKFKVPNSTTSIVKGGVHGGSLLTPENVEKIAEWLDAH